MEKLAILFESVRVGVAPLIGLRSDRTALQIVNRKIAKHDRLYLICAVSNGSRCWAALVTSAVHRGVAGTIELTGLTFYERRFFCIMDGTTRSLQVVGRAWKSNFLAGNPGQRSADSGAERATEIISDDWQIYAHGPRTPGIISAHASSSTVAR